MLGWGLGGGEGGVFVWMGVCVGMCQGGVSAEGESYKKLSSANIA